MDLLLDFCTLLITNGHLLFVIWVEIDSKVAYK